MKDRIVVVEHVYHQQKDSEATLTDCTFCRDVHNPDQPYERVHLTATEAWQPLIPVGCWIEKVGMILVINEEGKRFAVNPTPEELADVFSRVLEIKYNGSDPDDCWFVPPTEMFRGSPKHYEKLLVRCQNGKAKYTVSALPS